MLISASVIHIWLRKNLKLGKADLEKYTEVTETL